MLVAVALIAVAQLSLEPNFFLGLHTILDTGMFLLLGMRAILFWDLGAHIVQSFPKQIAITFALTSWPEAVHAFVSVEWTGSLAFLTQAAEILRPTTWPPAAHLLPTGLCGAI